MLAAAEFEIQTAFQYNQNEANGTKRWQQHVHTRYLDVEVLGNLAAYHARGQQQYYRRQFGTGADKVESVRQQHRAAEDYN